MVGGNDRIKRSHKDTNGQRAEVKRSGQRGRDKQMLERDSGKQ